MVHRLHLLNEENLIDKNQLSEHLSDECFFNYINELHNTYKTFILLKGLNNKDLNWIKRKDHEYLVKLYESNNKYNENLKNVVKIFEKTYYPINISSL